MLEADEVLKASYQQANQDHQQDLVVLVITVNEKCTALTLRAKAERTSTPVPTKTHDEDEEDAQTSMDSSIDGFTKHEIVKAIGKEKKAAAFVLVKVEHMWTFLYLMPEEAPVRSKMLYSSSMETLKRELKLPKAVPIESVETITEKLLMSAGQSGTDDDNKTTDTSANDEAESERRRAERSERISLHGEGGGGAGVMRVGFKLKEGVDDKLRTLLSKEAKGGVISLSVGAGEVLGLHGSDAQALMDVRDYADAVAKIRGFEGAPPVVHVILLSSSKSSNGDASAALVLHCPDNCHVRARMLHSAALSSMPSILEALGINVHKSTTVQSLEDVDEAVVGGGAADTESGAGADAASDAAAGLATETASVSLSSRPRPRGRQTGSRRLISSS